MRLINYFNKKLLRNHSIVLCSVPDFRAVCYGVAARPRQSSYEIKGYLNISSKITPVLVSYHIEYNIYVTSSYSS